MRERLSKLNTGHHVKYPLFLSHFNEICIFPTDFLKILKYQIPFKFVQRELTCSMKTAGWMDRQAGRQAGRLTDMMKLRVAFCNFVNAPKQCIIVQYAIY
jgi:hypothetical protein